MNKIVVAIHLNGSQSLHTLNEIASIVRGKTERQRVTALANWCYFREIRTLEIRNMDGTFDNWLIKMN